MSLSGNRSGLPQSLSSMACFAVKVVIQQHRPFPVARDHACAEIDKLLGCERAIIVPDCVQCGTHGIPDDRVQHFHLLVRQVSDVEVLHRIADDQSRIPEWQKNIKSGRIKKSLDELQLEFTQQLSRQIEAIERGDWYLKPDAYGREHTNITNLTSELRQFLSYHGEPLENVDTANSQPIFLGLSIRNAIKQEQEVPGTDTPYCSAFCVTKTEEEKVGLPAKILPIVLQIVQKKRRRASRTTSHRYSLLFCNLCRREEEEQVGLPVTDTPYCSANRAEDDDSVISEVDKYLQWCEEGIYDKLAIRTHQPRPKVKKDMFAGVLFSRENNWHNKTAVAFEKEFPYIRQQIRNMKAHGYQKVAHEMQRTEAAFMFTKVVPRLLQENPQMPIFTLHDSIVTTPHYSQYVQDVMVDEFRKLDINAKVRIDPCVQIAAA